MKEGKREGKKLEARRTTVQNPTTLAETAGAMRN